MRFSHSQPEHLLIGFSDEPVMEHVLENIPERERFGFLPLEALERDPDAYIICDNGALHLHSQATGSLTLMPGTPVYGRVFVRSSSEDSSAVRRFLEEYTNWSMSAPTGSLIVNRPIVCGATTSKIAHLSRLTACGFKVPPAILSTLPEALRTISNPIGKGNSTMRSEAQLMPVGDLYRQIAPLAIPALAQEFIKGFDVRAHFVGSRCIAIAIETDAVDYRYARRNGHELDFRPITLPPDVFDSCWAYMRMAGLEFGGFDFKVDADGQFWALECNSMPGFSFYDRQLDGAIVKALADYLVGGFSHIDSDASRGSMLDGERFPKLNTGGGQ